ncbi:MAG: winged helix-turn-helix domain-containing protein [Mogibacterium sp.]|nr:winged helix-turn-helix domain-containing protein [Mogibacterium sp.]
MCGYGFHIAHCPLAVRVSEDYKLREIWGPNQNGDNRILRVNMANIRRKIEKKPAEPEYIFTEAGVGYYMREPG